jgi:hypothetical protein
MAETSGISQLLDRLMSSISPQSAEAKVLGDKKAVEVLKEIMANPSTEYLPVLHKDIVRQADALPQTVRIGAAPDLNAVYGNAAEYDPKQDVIRYDPMYSNPDLGHLLPHELMHFMNAAKNLGIPGGVQHDVMRLLLGADRYKPAAELQGYQPPGTPPQYQDLIKDWIGR